MAWLPFAHWCGRCVFVSVQFHFFLVQRYTSVAGLHAVEECQAIYGHFQDQLSQYLKTMFFPYGDHGTGHVKLRLFHGLSRSGRVQISERPEYLRRLGTLS